MTEKKNFDGFLLQKEPLIYFASVAGKWLLKHTTPSWRIKDPDEGFQRMVKKERAIEIATAVLKQQRTFPNAIVLATNEKDFEINGCRIQIKDDVRFFIVDGQHRLWSQ